MELLPPPLFWGGDHVKVKKKWSKSKEMNSEIEIVGILNYDPRFFGWVPPPFKTML